MHARRNRNRWTLFLFILAGIVLGAVLSHYLGQYPSWGWLDFGQSFGLTEPATLSLGFLSVTFGLEGRITVGSLVGLLLALAAYKLSERL